MAVANNLLLRRAEIALRRCTNIHCDCICDEAKQEILEYIVEPTNQLWEDIHGINIKRKVHYLVAGGSGSRRDVPAIGKAVRKGPGHREQ